MYHCGTCRSNLPRGSHGMCHTTNTHCIASGLWQFVVAELVCISGVELNFASTKGLAQCVRILVASEDRSVTRMFDYCRPHGMLVVDLFLSAWEGVANWAVAVRSFPNLCQARVGFGQISSEVARIWVGFGPVQLVPLGFGQTWVRPSRPNFGLASANLSACLGPRAQLGCGELGLAWSWYAIGATGALVVARLLLLRVPSPSRRPARDPHSRHAHTEGRAPVAPILRIRARRAHFGSKL